jgi:hypothetical protein
MDCVVCAQAASDRLPTYESQSVQIELRRLYFWPTVTWEASFGPRGFGYKRLPGLLVLRDKGQHPCNAQRRDNGDTDAQPALQQ